MRKVCLSVVVLSMILLMVGISFAEPVPRGGVPSAGKSGFTNIAVYGLDQDGTDGLTDAGVPGYIEMTSTKGDVFYLYVGSDEILRIASETQVGYLASPATVGWSDASGKIVGNQQLDN